MIIRIGIDKEWSLDQLGRFLKGIQSVSELYEFGEIVGFFRVEDGAARYGGPRRGTPLMVHRLDYASPGIIEVVSQPEVLGPVLTFLQMNIYLFVKRNERRANANFIQAKADLIDEIRKQGNLPPGTDLDQIITDGSTSFDNCIGEVVSAANDGRLTDAAEGDGSF